MKQRTWSIDSLVLIFSFIVIAQLLSYVVPQGEFQRAPYADNPDRSAVVAGTYERLQPADQVTLPVWHFLVGITKGLADAQDIIFLIFILGGAIEILRRSGAIDAALHSAVDALDRSPAILIAGCFAVFSMGSYTIGMGEEYLPLMPIVVSMALAMRMDAVVAMAMVWIPSAIGWGCAGINPFGVLIAQNLAGVPATSGWAFRLVMMILFLAVAFHHVYRYALLVRQDGRNSLVADVDYSMGFEASSDSALNFTRVSILLVFGLGLAGFVYGAANHGWFVTELNTLFLTIGIVTALLARLTPSQTSQIFLEGAAKMAGPALVVGFARAIAIVLEDGKIIDTVIVSIAGLLDGMPSEVAAIGMLIVQSVFNLFIPGGSGQAFVTMPIMSPIATLTEVPQQTAVLAYQFGDGLTNMIVPTSALLMGALALARIPYVAWFKFVGGLLVKLLVLASMVLVASIHFAATFGL